MTVKQLTLQPAFVLHTRPYHDTSLLVTFLTEQHGKITLIARGVKTGRSPLAVILQPFMPLLIAFRQRGELGNLLQAERDNYHFDLAGELILTAFYLNELLVKLLPLGESDPRIYSLYKTTLERLSMPDQELIALRIFEKRLITLLGYGIELMRTVDGAVIVPANKYSYRFGYGFFSGVHGQVTNLLGESILALAREELHDSVAQNDAKRLLRAILAELLDHRPLKSREVFQFTPAEWE